jgi:hypothetical protein
MYLLLEQTALVFTLKRDSLPLYIPILPSRILVPNLNPSSTPAALNPSHLPTKGRIHAIPQSIEYQRNPAGSGVHPCSVTPVPLVGGRSETRGTGTLTARIAGYLTVPPYFRGVLQLPPTALWSLWYIECNYRDLRSCAGLALLRSVMGFAHCEHGREP